MKTSGQKQRGALAGVWISLLFFVLFATSCCAQSDSSVSKKTFDINFSFDDSEDAETGAALPLPLVDEPEFHHEEDIYHKPLYPLNNWDIAGIACASVGLMIAAGGGIGGGGVLVPIYILVLRFVPKFAIPLSNITIFGGAITNTVLNIPKRHPDANRPLVDWDLILIMEPLTIGGAIVGSFINKVLPDWVLALSLIVLLGATAQRTLKKGIKMYKKETAELQAEKESELTTLAKGKSQQTDKEASKPLLGDDEGEDQAEEEEEGGKDAEKGLVEDTKKVEEVDPELQAIYDAEKSTPWDKLGLLTGMFVIIIGLNLAKGGGAFPSPLGLTCGSFGFWFVTFLIFAWVMAVSLYVRQKLLDMYHTKKRLRYKYVPGDMEWDETATIKYPCLCFFAGFFAGMFGVGGGIVKGPLMLEMGVAPLVASATSAVMILYTSFAATTSFVVFGLLTWDYATYLFFVGIICTAIGQIGINYLIKKYKRNSYVVGSIGAIVALSAVMMTLQSVIAFLDGTVSHSGGICSAGE